MNEVLRLNPAPWRWSLTLREGASRGLLVLSIALLPVYWVFFWLIPQAEAPATNDVSPKEAQE